MDLDEFAGGADRTQGPGDVILLRWWSVDTITRPLPRVYDDCTRISHTLPDVCDRPHISAA
jgi:hypothetical protein